MNIRGTGAHALAWAGLSLTAGGILVVASALQPWWGPMGGAANPIVDLAQFVAAWAYLLATPVVATAGLVVRKGGRRWVAWTNATVLGVWLLAFAASFFLHT